MAVSTVFVEALVLATVSATFFFPARGFLFCASAAFYIVGSSMPSFCSVLMLHVPHLWPHSSEIAQLHRSLKEFIKDLIAVTSRLDAVVACINVSNPMEN